MYKAIITLIGIAGMIALLIISIANSDGIALDNCGVVSDRVKLAHRYHGILVSIKDESGEYFYRNGQRCQIYTKAFLKYEKRRSL